MYVIPFRNIKTYYVYHCPNKWDQNPMREHVLVERYLAYLFEKVQRSNF